MEVASTKKYTRMNNDTAQLTGVIKSCEERLRRQK